jgi:hypothetical protein
MIASRLGRANQDETSPFLLEFEVVARRAHHSQDETAPFPLEFMIAHADGAALVRAACADRFEGEGLPRLTWRGLDASPELREYAARIAAGEELPPFRGPILASPEAPPRSAPEASRPASGGDAKAFPKLALALIVMSAGLVATAVLGDDAELRAAGQAISGWFAGPSGSLEAVPTFEPAQHPAEGPCKPAATSTPVPVR